MRRAKTAFSFTLEAFIRGLAYAVVPGASSCPLSINANPKTAFILWWEGVDRTLFPKPRLPSAAAGKYETEKQGVEVHETTSLQKEFLGLRLVLEVAVRLKRSAVVGRGLKAVDGAAQEKGGEEYTRVGPETEPRALRREEALELMADIWTRGRGFVRCLARHVEGEWYSSSPGNCSVNHRGALLFHPSPPTVERVLTRGNYRYLERTPLAVLFWDGSFGLGRTLFFLAVAARDLESPPADSELNLC